ncbi:MAG: class I SAM-dependent methyltransferase [Termitinemataceae bacterium]
MMEPLRTWSTPVISEKGIPIDCPLCHSKHFIPSFDCGTYRYVQCKICGLIQQNPQPAADAVLKRYTTGSGSEYFAYEYTNEIVFLELQKQALHDAGFYGIEGALLADDRTPRILDVGCATGALLDYLRDRGWDTLGVELCGPAAEYAQTQRGLDVFIGTIEEAPYPPESFDVITASHIIEHVNDPVSFVARIYGLLKKGGYLFLTTPAADGFQARLFKSAWRSAIFDHLFLFSKRTIRQLLIKQGFTVETIATWGGLAKGTVPNWLKGIVDRLVKPLALGDVMIVRGRRR